MRYTLGQDFQWLSVAAVELRWKRKTTIIPTGKSVVSELHVGSGLPVRKILRHNVWRDSSSTAASRLVQTLHYFVAPAVSAELLVGRDGFSL